ncbi:MAG: hypothetical protein ACR2P0_06470 [Acidimicrobiales bacterium]
MGCGNDDLDAPWQSQLGSDAPDSSFGVAAAPNGDVVVAAATEGSLAGDHGGSRDIYVARFSGEGEPSWSIQLGGEASESPLGISVAPDDSVYVGGFTDGSFAGDNAGSADIWVARFDADGSELWRSQFGGDGWDRGFDVTAFDSGVYITGYTASVLDPETNHEGFDGFAARFDAAGEMQWIRQFGTDAADWGQGSSLAADGGLYVTGYTEGAMAGDHLGDKDGFIIRLTPGGETVWVQQFGSPALDWPQGVGTTNDGGVVVAGSTEGDLDGSNAGERDAFIAAFSETGEQQFISQLGTAAADSVFEIRTFNDGFVATGSTAGDLNGANGDRDGLLVWFDEAGAVVSIDQIGTAAVDDLTGLAVSENDVVFYSGTGPGSGSAEGDIDVVLGATDGPADG